jgi:hypothetical protein
MQQSAYTLDPVFLVLLVYMGLDMQIENGNQRMQQEDWTDQDQNALSD